MNLPRQTKMDLSIDESIALVGLETARAHIGRDAETVMTRVENGNLRWVFDLRVAGPARDKATAGQRERKHLRFWIRELQQPVNCNLHLTEVIAAILGQGETVRRGVIEQRWIVNHATIGRWIASKELVLLDQGRITRASLEAFLSARWTGRSGLTPSPVNPAL